MEFLAALTSTLFSAGTATTAAAVLDPIAGAAAAGAAGTAAAAGSTALSVLQGGLTGAAMIASLGSGLAGYQEGKLSKQLYEADASSEQLASEQKALDIRKRALTQMAESRVAFSASGVDISTGTPEAAAAAAENERDYQLSIERENGLIRAMRSKIQGAAASLRGDASLIAGIGSAAKAGVGYAIDIRKRG
jgi:hypothetical protein